VCDTERETVLPAPSRVREGVIPDGLEPRQFEPARHGHGFDELVADVNNAKSALVPASRREGRPLPRPAVWTPCGHGGDKIAQNGSVLLTQAKNENQGK